MEIKLTVFDWAEHTAVWVYKCPPFSQCNVEGFAMCHEDISEQHKHTHTERSASSPITIQLLQSMDDDALSEALIRNILINI